MVGDLYERDLPSVRVGTPATVIIPAVPQIRLRGRVSYIDPRVDPAARTARVRVELPNLNQALRLGMFVSLEFQTGSDRRRLMVPRGAVQAIGDHSVVYVMADDRGTIRRAPGEARSAGRGVHRSLGRPQTRREDRDER
ncbi:MAG: efflux RND transporter periplasmic adaptor subunit [Candidatus Rokuibacteriota bacterium]